MANRYVAAAPEFIPVPLSALKAHLKIQSDAQDAVLTDALNDAVDLIERYTARYLAQREVIAHVDELELGGSTMASPYAWLKRAPVLDDAVSTVVVDGTSLPPTDWRLKISGEQAHVHLLQGVTSVAGALPYPLKITFKAGYKTAQDVPAGLRRAVLELATHLYTNPGDCGGCEGGGSSASEIPASIRAKLSLYTIRRVFA
ncbi:phage head-tail connector protein [Lysobacter sp. GCM10012299]|uniref:head-tail connector protein n=1 Tax=Lysobacter sp. GCM10012299 TaxID=3317333 RepID=UPI003606DCAB